MGVDHQHEVQLQEELKEDPDHLILSELLRGLLNALFEARKAHLLETPHGFLVLQTELLDYGFLFDGIRVEDDEHLQYSQCHDIQCKRREENKACRLLILVYHVEESESTEELKHHFD